MPGINNWSDYYGDAAVGAMGMGQATSALGPNQSIVTGPGQSAVMASGGKAPAISWVMMMLVLMGLYTAIKIGMRMSSVV